MNWRWCDPILRDYFGGVYGGLKAASWKFAEEADGGSTSRTSAANPSAVEEQVIDRIESFRVDTRMVHRCVQSLPSRFRVILEAYYTRPGFVSVAGLGELYRVALCVAGGHVALRSMVRSRKLAEVETMASYALDEAGNACSSSLRSAMSEATTTARENRYT